MRCEWALSNLDLFSLNMAIRGVWIYNKLPDTEKMQQALNTLVATYPHLCGRYNKGKKCVEWDDGATDQITLKAVEEPSLYAGEILKNNNRLRSILPKFNLNDYKNGKISPLAATLIHLKDHTVLIIDCAHSVADGASFYNLCQQWASLTQGKSIVPMTVDQSQLPPCDFMSKEKTIKKVIEERWVKMSVGKFVKMTWNMLRTLPYKDTYTEEFSRQEIENWKNCSGAGTHAVLCAIALQHIAQQLGEPTFKIITTADLRGRLKGVDATFMGNLSQPFVSDSTYNADNDINQLAAQIQAENDLILHSDRLDSMTRLSRCVSHYSLPYFYFDPSDGFSTHPTCIYINNQIKLRACELDFGTGLPLHALPNNLPDMVKFWQPTADGPVQIIYGGYIAHLMVN